MTKIVAGYGFLTPICIKAILPSRQNETMLNQRSYAISVLSYYSFYLQAKEYPLKIVLVETILRKINRRGLE